ncbi:MAG TPA: BMC domain-containing protein [Halanaerobiales bacterium]|nr:BMC domain-containing protein [Halanaerobiales bacterium]
MKQSDSLGFIEIRSKALIITAMDEMLKTGKIKIAGLQKCGSAYITAAVSGKIEAISSAIDVGLSSVKKINNHPVIKKNNNMGQIISSYIVSKPEIDFIDIFFENKPGIKYNREGAIGFIDSRGLISLLAAADIISKRFPVKIIACQKLGSGRLNLSFVGEYDSVQMAVETGIDIARKHGKFIGSSILANPHPEIRNML